MPPRTAAATTVATAAALSLEITEKFSSLRSLRLAVAFRRVDDARDVLGISDTARARTAGRQKQKLIRKACGDDVTVLRYTPEVEYMVQQLMATFTHASSVCAGGTTTERTA